MKAFPLALLLVGCTEEITPEDPEVTCDTTIPATWPLDGSSQAYNRGDIEFTLSEPDDTAVVVADFDGVQSTRNDGLTIVYTPTEPLEPDTAYAVSLTYCRGTASIDFTTSELGGELEGELDLVGRVYAMDFGGARYLSGDGVGQIITTFIGDYALLQVIEATDDVLQMRVAITADDNGDLIQDPCSTTANLPQADFSARPWFTHPVDDVVFDAFDVQMHLNDFTSSGTIAPAGDWIGGIAVNVTLDTREAALMLGLAAEDICVLAENVGLACEPCADGESYCGTLEMRELNAPEVMIDVVEITELGPECDDATD
jgi:hypothetical protein